MEDGVSILTPAKYLSISFSPSPIALGFMPDSKMMDKLLNLLLLWNDKYPEDVDAPFGWAGVIVVLIIIIGGELVAKHDKKNKNKW